MKRDYHRWFSPSLGRDMELVVFGHAGSRVLAFPPCEGRFFDWEDRGMIAAVADWIDAGLFQITCVDSVDGEAWFADAKHPADRAWRHAQYDAYLRYEVLPLTGQLNPDPCLITAGTSFGAYHALNFAFRYPDLVARTLSLSGLWDLRWRCDGYFDQTVYFHNPLDYLSGEHEAGRLGALRKMEIILAVGRDEYVLPNAERLSRILWDQGVWHALRVWDGPAHDWPCWQRMLRLYLRGPD